MFKSWQPLNYQLKCVFWVPKWQFFWHNIKAITCGHIGHFSEIEAISWLHGLKRFIKTWFSVGFSGIICFPLVRFDCSDLFCKVFCLSLNNFLCKIGPLSVFYKGIEGCNCTVCWNYINWFYTRFHNFETGIVGYIHGFGGWDLLCKINCLFLNNFYCIIGPLTDFF